MACLDYGQRQEVPPGVDEQAAVLEARAVLHGRGVDQPQRPLGGALLVVVAPPPVLLVLAVVPAVVAPPQQRVRCSTDEAQQPGQRLRLQRHTTAT